MTTIAYKDGIIAADSQITWDGSIRGISAPKIEVLPNGVVFAASGRVDAISAAKRFLSQDNWEEKIEDTRPPKGSFEALCFYKGKLYIFTNSFYPEQLYDTIYASGSGYKFAMAAMNLGLSAEEAVKFASTLDVFTNDKVQLFNVKDLQEKTTGSSRVRRKGKTHL